MGIWRETRVRKRQTGAKCWTASFAVLRKQWQQNVKFQGFCNTNIRLTSIRSTSEFIFLVSKIATDGDFSHEIKRHLSLGRKVMANLESTLGSRYITLVTKIHTVKTMVLTLFSDTSCLSGYNGLPKRLNGKESACWYRRCRRGRFDPWLGKLSWRNKWQPTPEFLLGKIPRTEYPGGL